MMMYIITRFFDDGTAKAKLTYRSDYCNHGDGCYDQYIESVGKGGDYENVEEWCDEMGIDFDDMEDMMVYSGTNLWFDISAYC